MFKYSQIYKENLQGGKRANRKNKQKIKKKSFTKKEM